MHGAININIKLMVFNYIFMHNSQYCEKPLSAVTCSSILLLARNDWPATGQIRMKFDVRIFFEHLSEKLEFN